MVWRELKRQFLRDIHKIDSEDKMARWLLETGAIIRISTRLSKLASKLDDEKEDF